MDKLEILKNTEKQLSNPQISWKRKNDLLKYKKRLKREIKREKEKANYEN